MARKPILLLAGSDFSSDVDLNDGLLFNARTVGLFATPENTLDLADTAYNTPYINRTRTKERVFSIMLDIVSPNAYDDNWILNKAYLESLLYQEDTQGKRLPVRIQVQRNGIGTVYVEATCETMVQTAPDTDPRLFQISFTAVDPYFTRVSGNDSQSINTGGGPTYTPLPIPVNVGTSIAEPTITFNLSSHGGVYRYYRLITVTNNSIYPLSYYPICIDLGDIRSLVGTKYNEVNPGVDRRIRDLRIETLSGARKIVFLRDSGDTGGTWHQSVKLWTVLYSLKPGESKQLRVLYGNAFAPSNELDETANFTIKPMFNMYNSSNSLWQYVDFMPTYTAPQTRARQWLWYIPGANNLTFIGYAFNHFDVGPDGNVPCAGAKALYYAPSSGVAGLKLHCPVPPSQVFFTYRLSTNAKAPFALRSQRPDGRLVDDFTHPNNQSGQGKSVLSETHYAILGGDNLFTLDNISRGGDTIIVGDIINFAKDDGTNFRATVTAITPNLGLYSVTFTPAMSGTVGAVQCSAGNAVQQGYFASATILYPSSDGPNLIAFILRGDSPQNTTGSWFYGGAELVEITWDSTKRPAVTAWGSAAEVDLASNGYQLRGSFGNVTLNEFLHINTIVSSPGDEIVVDCKARTCTYYHWNGTGYDAGENRLEAITFPAIRRYWIHVIPNLAQYVNFLADTDSNFSNADVTITVPVRYLS